MKSTSVPFRMSRPGQTVRLPLRAAFVLLMACGVATTPHASAQEYQGYVIGPLDVLDIQVFEQPDLSGRYTVGTEGSISFPLIGRIDAERTARGLEELLGERLAAGFLRDPRVNVTVAEYRSRRVFILGEVSAPGAYPLAVPMTLIELLALAGGSTYLASTEAMVLRGAALPAEPPRPQESSGSDALRVDLEALAQGDLSQNVTLRHGDTVFVPRVAVAYVFGEVRKPGRYEIRDDTTVLHALTLAGGTTAFAAVNRLRIVRTVNGEQVETPAELSDLVRPGDVVRVPERFF